MSKQQRRKGNAKNASSASAHGYLAEGNIFVGLTPEMNIFEVASSNQLHQISEIDDETRIVMKKLTKKDGLTREKGLKELMALVGSESSSEKSYEHFCGLVPQLATDGSPTVRMLTMKVITMYLVQLKKAALKGLKKIIPMVLFAKSDVTNGVAAAASSVIRDGFDADKKAKIIETFGPLTFEMAANIAQGKHELCILKEYDASEDKEARSSRLETQSLNVFLSFIKEQGSLSSASSESSQMWEEPAKKLFENSEFIKKAFSGKRESLKVQLLSICYKFSNTDILMSLPTVLPYIQNTLDAQTFTPECATAWEGLVLLLKSEKFKEKTSLQKAILPRILNVVRKKGSHWRVLKHYLLPVVALLLPQLEDEQKTLTSIVSSFTDNLPWANDASMNAVHCWFHCFADFVRWIMSNKKGAELELVLVELTVKMSEQAMLFNTSESTECISQLIFWLIESHEPANLCNLLELSILEHSEQSGALRNALTAPGKLLQLAELHGMLLSVKEIVDFNAIRNLANSSDEYFDATLKSIKSYDFLEKEQKFDEKEAEDVVKLISRILKKGEILKVRVENDALGRHLLLSEDEHIWIELFRSAPERLFLEMIEHWHLNRNGRANAKAVSFLRRMGISLDIKEAAENVDFLISLLNSSSEEQERKRLIEQLFAALFEAEEEPKTEHFESVSKNLNELEAEGFFEKLLKNDEEMEAERILELAGRFDKVIDGNEQVAQKLLSSKEEHRKMEQNLHFLELDVLTYSPKSHLLTDVFKRKIENPDEQEAVRIVKSISRRALFDLGSKYHSSIHQLFGFQTIEVIRALGARYCLKEQDEELQMLNEEILKRLSRSDELQGMVLDSSAPNFLINAFGLTFEQERKLAYFAELQEQDETQEQKEQHEHKIETLFADSLGFKYLETVFLASKEHKSFELFQLSPDNQYEQLANLLFAKKFVECGGEILSTSNYELRDFALCGVVMLLDQASELLTAAPDDFFSSPVFEALTACYLEVFAVLETWAQGAEPEHVAEWNEFYAPTIRTYFIRMFRSIRKEQQPTPLVRSILKVLFLLAEFPSDVPNDDAKEFVPELAEFKYPQFQESCISHAFSLMTSRVEHVQLVGFAVAKLLMPIMFQMENSVALRAQDESEVSVSPSRPKLTVPVMIKKTDPSEPHPHLNALLFDLALVPLLTPIEHFGQEHRVAYCEAINPFLKTAMNCLLVDQPFDFTRVPIICRIPKSQERDYYQSTDLSPSPAFFQKFATRLLYKSLSLLPATVRLYYKSLSNPFGPLFAESVTRFASRMLIEQELSKVKEAEFSGEMKVRTVPVTGEIIADYVVDETKMKLTIGLPPDYPLSVPSLSIDNSIVKNDRAKKWLLQLNAYLFHQNGAILEGIEMWKRNVDKGVEGAEDCCICMMTVHQQTHQLPKVKCKQCKNKFHSNCLYKWFESSNQATCPLCRNNFT